MKNSKFLSLAVIALIALFISSCGGIKKMKKNAELVSYTVTPKILEMHADSVEISITGKFPPKYFSKKVIVEATPVVKYKDGEKAYKVQKLQGEKVEDNNPVISYVDGGSFSYTDKIPYNKGMRVSDLEIRISGYKAGHEDKKLDFDPKKIADGVIATPGLVQADAKAIMGKDKFQRIIPESKSADIHFAIQQAIIKSKELKQEDIKALQDYIDEVNKNERKEFKGINLSAYASPDGGLDLNTKLAQNRAKSTEKYLKKELKDVEAASKEGFVSESTTAEDWDGFKQLMETSDVADKDLILRVLSMYSDPDVREKEIKNISKAYLEVADKVLPQLRRSKLNVNVDLIGYSDDEITKIFNEKPDSLKLEEMLYAATLTNDFNQKLKVYQQVVKTYPNDWRGPNNVGYAYVNLNKIDDAKKAFEDAKKLDESNPIIINNCGVIALMKGEVDKAEEKFKAASGAGSEVNYNLGIVSIKKADYAGAVNYFGDACSFNAGLAKLLNGDNDGAVKAVDCAKDKDAAMNYYLKAIAGARSGDTDMMYNNLRAAISKDASLTNLAKTDMEFGKYFTDDTFKTIVK